MSLDDFDTEPPGNYDDEQLLDEDSVPKPDTEFTQSTVARALRRTFALRLAVVKQLNDFKPQGTYDDTLRLDTEFRKSWKAMSRTLQACKNNSPPQTGDFAMRTADYIMSHYLSILHAPFFGAGLQEAAYAYSRKVTVEMSLKAWTLAHHDLVKTGGVDPSDEPPACGILSRLCVGGSSGYFRTVSFQCGFIIGLELSAQLREESCLGPATVRPDLHAVVENAKTITLRALEAGRTNMKGHLLMSTLSAHIDGLRRAVSKDEMSRLIGRATVEAEERVLPILEKMAAQYETSEELATGVDETPMEAVDFMADWGFMVC